MNEMKLLLLMMMLGMKMRQAPFTDIMSPRGQINMVAAMVSSSAKVAQQSG